MANTRKLPALAINASHFWGWLFTFTGDTRENTFMPPAYPSLNENRHAEQGQMPTEKMQPGVHQLLPQSPERGRDRRHG